MLRIHSKPDRNSQKGTVYSVYQFQNFNSIHEFFINQIEFVENNYMTNNQKRLVKLVKLVLIGQTIPWKSRIIVVGFGEQGI